MAGETLFHSGRVLPQVRPTHVGMALKALKVAVLCAYQSVRHRAVGVVAIRALHFSFPDGMMGLSQELGFNPFMTLGAHLRFSRLGEPFGVFLVRVVAIRAGESPLLMGATVP